MADDIDIEEHDVMDNSCIQNMFPDLSIVKTETMEYDEYEFQDTHDNQESQVCDDEASNPSSSEESDPNLQPEVPDSTTDVDVVPPRTADSPQVVSSTQHDESSFFGNRLIVGNKRKCDEVQTEDNVEEDDNTTAIEYEEKCFRSYVSLKDWGEYLGESDTYCAECKVLFATVNALDSHKMQAHSFLVAVSGFESEENDEFENDAGGSNMSRSCAEDSDIKCFVCSKVFAVKDDLIQHIYESHLNTLKCKICDEDFTVREEFDRHMISHNVTKVSGKSKGVHQCDVCRCHFILEVTYTSHCLVNHKIKDAMVPKLRFLQPKCDICNKMTGSMKALNAHIKYKHMDYFMKIVKKNVSKKSTIKSVVASQKTLVNTESKSVQPALVVNKKFSVPAYFKCTLCKQLFDDRLSAQLHKRRMHPGIKNPKIIIRQSKLATSATKSISSVPKITAKDTTLKKDKTILVQKSILFKCYKCKVHFTKWSLANTHCTNGCGKEQIYSCVKCKLKLTTQERVVHDLQHRFISKFTVHYRDIKEMHLRIIARCPKCQGHYSEMHIQEHYDKCTRKLVNTQYCQYCGLTVGKESVKMHFVTHKAMDFLRKDYIVLKYAEVYRSQVKNTVPVATQKNIATSPSESQPVPSLKTNPLAFWYCKNCEAYMPCDSLNQFGIDRHRTRKCLELKRKKYRKYCKICHLYIYDHEEHRKLHDQHKFNANDISTYNIQDGTEINVPKSVKRLFKNTPVISKNSLALPKNKSATSPSRQSKVNWSQAQKYIREKNHIGYCFNCNKYTGRLTNFAIAYHTKGVCLNSNPATPLAYCTCGLVMQQTAVQNHASLQAEHHTLKDSVFININTMKPIDPPMPMLCKCTKCDVQFTTKADHDAHWELNVDSKICHVDFVTCDVCNEKLTNDAYKIHVQYHMFNSNKKLTPKKITSASDANAKDKTKYNLYQCNNCSVCFHNVKSQNRHVCKIITGKTFKCKNCGLIFHRKSLLKHGQVHRTTNNFNVKKFKPIQSDTTYRAYKCAKCLVYLLSPTGKALHVCRNNLRKYVKCSICKWTFSAQSFKAHKVWHSLKHFSMNKVKVVTFNGEDSGKQQEPEISQITLYRCKLCLICQHDRDHVCDESVKKVQCGYCHFYFDGNEYNSHKKVHKESGAHRQPVKIVPITPSVPGSRKRRLDTETSTSSSNGKIYKCECGLCFVCESSATTHIDQCNLTPNENGLECSKCDNKFDTEQLFKHSLKHHKDDDLNCDIVNLTKDKKDIKCVHVCGKCNCAFDTPSLCLTHSKVCKANKEKGVKCKRCDLLLHSTVLAHKCAIKYQYMYILARTNYPDASDMFSCNRCQINYNTMVAAERHVQTNHVSFYKPVKCFRCKVFFNAATIDTHKRMHREKPNSLFNVIEIYDEEMSKDIAVRNKNSKGIKIEPQEMTSEDTGEANNNLYKCQKCDIHFVREHGAKKHVDNNHQCARKYNCISCDLSIAVMDKTLHDQIHHDIFNYTSESDYKITVVDDTQLNEDVKTKLRIKSFVSNDEDITNVLYKCLRCSVHFITEKSYKKHYHWHYEIKLPVQCELCGLHFSTHGLKAHKITHHLRLKLTRDDLIVDSPDYKNNDSLVSDMDSSVKEEVVDDTEADDSTINDTVSDTVKEESSVAEDHDIDDATNVDTNKTYKNKLYKCEKCNVHFVAAITLRKHISKHVPIRYLFDCEDCGLSFTKCSLTEHRRHHEQQDYNIDEVTIMTIEDLNRVYNSGRGNYALRCDEARKLYKCQRCNVHFFVIETYMKHLTNHTNIKNQLACEICSLTFSRQALKKHNLLHHVNNQFTVDDLQIESPTVDKLKRMSVTNVLFDGSNVVLKTEEKQDTEPNTVEAKDTSEKLRNVTNNAEKYKIKFYRCKECRVDFLKQNQCYKHAVNHVEISTYDFMECKLCGLNFLLTSLPAHMTMHKTQEFTLSDVLIEEYEPIDRGSSKNKVPKIEIYMASVGPDCGKDITKDNESVKCTEDAIGNTEISDTLVTKVIQDEENNIVKDVENCERLDTATEESGQDKESLSTESAVEKEKEGDTVTCDKKDDNEERLDNITTEDLGKDERSLCTETVVEKNDLSTKEDIDTNIEDKLECDKQVETDGILEDTNGEDIIDKQVEIEGRYATEKSSNDEESLCTVPVEQEKDLSIKEDIDSNVEDTVEKQVETDEILDNTVTEGLCKVDGSLFTEIKEKNDLSIKKYADANKEDSMECDKQVVIDKRLDNTATEDKESLYTVPTEEKKDLSIEEDFDTNSGQTLTKASLCTEPAEEKKDLSIEEDFDTNSGQTLTKASLCTEPAEEKNDLSSKEVNDKNVEGTLECDVQIKNGADSILASKSNDNLDTNISTCTDSTVEKDVLVKEPIENQDSNQKDINEAQNNDQSTLTEHKDTVTSKEISDAKNVSNSFDDDDDDLYENMQLSDEEPSFKETSDVTNDKEINNLDKDKQNLNSL